MEEVVVCALLCLFAMNRARDYLEDRYDRILSLLEGESFDSKMFSKGKDGRDSL
jgi:hypothetical protein